MDMAGMTGLELLDAVRRVAPSLPLAVVSAHPVDDALASRPGPADAYLEKPLRVDQLIATATALIGRDARPGPRPVPGLIVSLIRTLRGAIPFRRDDQCRRR